MVLSKTLSNWTITEPEADTLSLIPPYKFIPLKKGDRFNFIRFTVDDFNTSPYFEGLTGAGVRVAVLDTGCDPNHPALKDRIDVSASKNYTRDNGGDPNDFSDGQGHGTHVAGIIAAENRSEIMYGVAPDATIVVKKVLSNNGEPRFDIKNVPLRIAAAIRDATAEGCKVISMSLGLPERGLRQYGAEMAELYLSVQEALAAGVTVVAAAGNDGTTLTNTIDPPGSYGGVVTIASHDDNGQRSFFSSYGGELDFMAPGEVISTWPGGTYRSLRGTSMATPLVAGLAALLIEAGQRTSPDSLSGPLTFDMGRTGFRARNNYEVRELLRLLADRPEEHSRVDGYGKLSRAYQYVNGEVPDSI